MLSGAFLALHKFETLRYQAALASPAIQYPLIGKLPLDLQLDLEKRQPKDTVYLPGDTVFKEKQVIKPKYVKVPQQKRTTDTLYLSMPIPGPVDGVSVSKSIAGDREEHTPVNLFGPKSNSIILTVDGQVVYSTENDIHSTEDRQ